MNVDTPKVRYETSTADGPHPSPPGLLFCTGWWLLQHRVNCAEHLFGAAVPAAQTSVLPTWFCQATLRRPFSLCQVVCNSNSTEQLIPLDSILQNNIEHLPSSIYPIYSLTFPVSCLFYLLSTANPGTAAMNCSLQCSPLWDGQLWRWCVTSSPWKYHAWGVPSGNIAI